MGTQDEYLRNFTVLLTEKGVVPLTDPMQIAVYNELCSGSKRPSDISASLGVPSSSLHFVLDKMVDSGVIVRSKPDPEKKSVYYSNLALKIAGSRTPEENAAAECEETFLDPARHYSGMAAVANMLDHYTAEIGLSLDQLRMKYARELADSMKPQMPSGGLEDSLPAIRERFASSTGFRLSVFALNPLTLVFEGDRVMASQMDMLSEFVSRMVENSTGRTYAVVSEEDFSSGDTARYKVVYDRRERAPEPYINMSLPQSQSVDRFLMVDLDGSVGLITSPVQIQIVDAVYERPLCVTDIVNKVEAPRSTVTSNILRMVEDGVVSVFYSESGTAYYGMSCSILMKKSRCINRDASDCHRILADARSKEGAFMEGYLLYILSSLRSLGFDTDYMMVVLGAKYMRVASHDGPRNFDVFFGKMSDIAQTIGLSLNVVSIYPLTIGITSNDPESEMSPAMTFVKGMAHQGLEMASNGIFVRVSDDTPADRKVSFKEIYPALSMTPLEGIAVEGLAEATPAKAKKKRTSSVKTALINRSVKESGRPVRTVRYITGVALLMMLSAVIVFGFTGNDNSTSAEMYSVGLDDDVEGVLFYDTEDNILEMPLTSEAGQSIHFSIAYTEGFGADAIGVVMDGVSYTLDSIADCNDGVYTVTTSGDLMFRTLTQLQLPEDDGLAYRIYCFDESVSSSYAYCYGGFMDLDEYVSLSGGLWVNDDCVIEVTSADGRYISTVQGNDATYYMTRLICSPDEVAGMTSESIPRNSVSVRLDGDFEADGWFVNGYLLVAPETTLSLKFVSTDGNVALSTITASGSERPLALSGIDRTVTFYVGSEDLILTYRYTGIY